MLIKDKQEKGYLEKLRYIIIGTSLENTNVFGFLGTFSVNFKRNISIKANV
jgi:hypothetical protein